MYQVVNTILAKRVNHIVAKGGNPACPKGSKSRGFSTAQRNSKKEKVLWKSVKAPPWHKRKKKWASRHKSETIIARSGVTQSPFLRLCGSRHTVVQNPFGRWCTDGQNRFYGKARKNKVKKSGRFCLNLPFYLYFCTWRVLWRLRNVQKDDAVDN